MYYSFRCNMYPFFSIHVCITYDLLFLFAFTYRFKPYSQVVFICFLCCYHQQCCILQFTYICICYEEKKKMLHILHEKWQEEKNTWKETGWNSTNSPIYVTSKCILKLIRISLIFLYSEQSVFTSEMKFWYVHDFQKHYLYFKTQCVYKYSVLVPLVSPFLMHTALPYFISYYYR